MTVVDENADSRRDKLLLESFHGKRESKKIVERIGDEETGML